MITMTLTNLTAASIGSGTLTPLPKPFDWATIVASGTQAYVVTEQDMLKDWAGASGFGAAQALQPLIQNGTISVAYTNATAGTGDVLSNVVRQNSFVSAVQTGTGSAQNIAHGMGVVPASVMLGLTGGPAAYTQPVTTFGAHTAVNIVVTMTLNWQYQVYAWA